MSLLVGIRVIFLIIANILNAINTRVKRGVYQFQLHIIKEPLNTHIFGYYTSLWYKGKGLDTRQKEGSIKITSRNIHVLRKC